MKTTFYRRWGWAIPTALIRRRNLGCVAVYLASALFGGSARAQTNAPSATPPESSANSTNVTTLQSVDVIGKKLDVARNAILPDLGATVYTLNNAQISTLPQGENAPFNQVLLNTPGMAQDSAVNGDLHLRGEHANIQYRINDVLLPEGISSFGQELDTRFVDSMRLITGSLPAEYGFRTAGVVDIQTKSGAFENGGEASMYGGSYDTLRPSFEYGGSEGKLNYFLDGSYDHNDIGIENPTGSSYPIHDTTDQGKSFMYLSYLIDDTSRISAMASASYSTFQVPNVPGNTTPAFPGAPGQPATFNSADLNENQKEQNYYAVVAYQKSTDKLNLQVAAYGRNSDVHFMPDPIGDLYFNGVESDVNRRIYSGGLQADASYELTDNNTIRGGIMLLDEFLSSHTITTVYDLDPSTGQPTGPAFPIVQNSPAHAIFAGIYLQDEWKIVPQLTLNFGARFDEFYASFDKENQPSPRVNLIWQPTDDTTLHAGYARYFTPPPLENVPEGNVEAFAGTSNQDPNNSPINGVKAERANYFDAGVSQKLAPGLQVGLDGYYKNAVNQLDDGLFGQSLILQAFNYAEGRIWGTEFTASYTSGGFSTFANVAYSVAQGKDWNSAQFLFSANDLAYVQNHWIYLDHDQRVTGSFGASYTWKESHGGTQVFVDALYGSGLRQDGGGFEPNSPTSPIPNGASVPAYYSVSLGAEQAFRLSGKQMLKARIDVVNITDNVYQLRSGTGVGVNAAQYGMRLGIFGTVSYAF